MENATDRPQWYERQEKCDLPKYLRFDTPDDLPHAFDDEGRYISHPEQKGLVVSLREGNTFVISTGIYCRIASEPEVVWRWRAHELAQAEAGQLKPDSVRIAELEGLVERLLRYKKALQLLEQGVIVAVAALGQGQYHITRRGVGYTVGSTYGVPLVNAMIAVSQEMPVVTLQPATTVGMGP